MPEQCVESTVSHALTRSKVSRVSKKSEISETSPARDHLGKPKSRYTSTKKNKKGECHECSRFEPVAFSECY